MRRPNSSRIRSLKPLPVTAPIRAHISCTTISAIVIGMHGPQQQIAELRAGLRVGQDAAGIVIDVRGNEAGTDNSEEQQDPAFGTFEELHAQISQT